MPKAEPAPAFYRDMLGLLRPYWPAAAAATALGAVSGLTTMWLLAAINRGLHAPVEFAWATLLQFAGLCVLSVGGGVVSGVGNTLVGQRIVAVLRKSIAARILRAPIAQIEHYRGYRLLAVLTTDIDAVGTFTFQFPAFVIALAIAAGSFGYLFLLSPAVFALCACGAALGIAAGVGAQRGGLKAYDGVRNAEDELRKQYRAITDGAKELRLNRARRVRVHEVLLSGAVERIARLRVGALRRFWLVDALSSTLFFAVIGILLVARHQLGIGGETLSGAVLVLLFARGPIEQTVAILPQLGQAQVSFRRIAALSAELSAPAMLRDDPAAVLAPSWQAIELRDARYRFVAPDGATAFALGPIGLRIARGETVFIVGENGSGKTTLIKLLLGLYTPTEGCLLCDDKEVSVDALDDYRQMFSAVFSDYFLFEDLPRSDPGQAPRAASHLERLQIAHKVRVQGDAFTSTDLSGGERKRLALVQALLEDRPIMMFDEWAADQDPTFRRVFYAEILPELKRQGKTLIVVSHDDRYFAVADRVVRMSDGRIAA